MRVQRVGQNWSNNLRPGFEGDLCGSFVGQWKSFTYQSKVPSKALPSLVHPHPASAGMSRPSLAHCPGIHGEQHAGFPRPQRGRWFNSHAPIVFLDWCHNWWVAWVQQSRRSLCSPILQLTRCGCGVRGKMGLHRNNCSEHAESIQKELPGNHSACKPSSSENQDSS